MNVDNVFPVVAFIYAIGAYDFYTSGNLLGAVAMAAMTVVCIHIAWETRSVSQPISSSYHAKEKIPRPSNH